jgi:hypothetical protein
LGDGDSGALGVMAKDCRSGDGESLRQAFAINVLTWRAVTSTKVWHREMVLPSTAHAHQKQRDSKRNWILLRLLLLGNPRAAFSHVR